MLFWLAGGWLVAAALRAEEVPLRLEGGALDPASAELQTQFLLFKSFASAPVVQRLSATGTAPWLVQFAGAIREDRKAALEKLGAAVRGYIPENGFLVEATPRQIAQIAAGTDVVWIGEYLPAYKQAKAVREWRPANPDETREFRVQLLGMEGKGRVMRELGEMNAPVSREEAQSARTSFRTWLAPKQVAEVANWGEVEWIEFRQPARPWGTSFPETEAAGALDDPEAALRLAFAAGERVCAEIRGIADAGAYGEEARAVDRFVWEHPEMLVVAAAGNAAVDLNPADGVADAGSAGSPATAKNALAVGAAEGRGAATRVWRDSWPGILRCSRSPSIRWRRRTDRRAWRRSPGAVPAPTGASSPISWRPEPSSRFRVRRMRPRPGGAWRPPRTSSIPAARAWRRSRSRPPRSRRANG